MINFELQTLLVCLSLALPASSMVPGACTVLVKSGDISIGGIFPFRYSSTSLCSQSSGVSFWGIRSTEALIWAIEEINARDDILPNITLGYQIRDDCRSEDVALWSTLSFFSDTCSSYTNQQESTVLGIVGGAWSSTTVWMAKVGNLFQVPFISYSATSDELSDTVRFPYFFRTIPPDRFQVGAIMDILLKFNWRYIALIYSTDSYGLHGGRQVRSAAESNGICIALSASIQPYAPKYEVEEVVGKLLKVPKVKVAVIFSLSTVAYTVLSTIKSMGLVFNITWIGSDGWGGSSMYGSRGLGNITMGSIFLRLRTQEPRKFTQYFDSLTPDSHSGSPWFDAYWKKFNCTMVSKCPFPRYSDANVIKGVKALGYALDAMWRDSCLRSECYCPDNFTGTELKQYLYNVSFNSTNGQFKFDEFGDSAGEYKIVNLQKNGNEFAMKTVGFWDPRNLRGSELQIDQDKMQFFGESNEPPFSLCRENCPSGHIIVPLEQKCCFGCQACPENAMVNDSVCQKCPITHWPNEDRTSCDKIKPTAVSCNLKEPLITSVMMLLAIGTTLSLVVSCGLWYNRNHPLVKATSRELSAVHVFGLLLAFIDAFAFLGEPTAVVCVVAESLLSLCFNLIIVPTLLKVIRIYRIFRAGKKSVRRPRFVGIRDQVIMMSLLISIQVGIIVIFSSVYPTKPAMLFVSPPKNYIGIYCGLGTSFLVSSVYNLILVIISCYYAFLARKVPSNYNESKFIGISVYSMLIITLAAVPVYSTATGILQIVTALCMVLLLNAYLGLVCVYLPKLYAIYFKGDDVDVDDWKTASLSLSTRSAQVQPSVAGD